ncbi:MAG TPA: hypothetical protein VND23_05900 [Acidimicrobiales bacterium]|nr:hypothetical protein [Acidimicrobiales bacterium]
MLEATPGVEGVDTARGVLGLLPTGSEAEHGASGGSTYGKK